MGDIQAYDAVLNGMPTKLLLTEDQARERGLVEAVPVDEPPADAVAAEVVEGADGTPVIQEKQAPAPRNKARRAPNKGDAGA